MKRGWAHHTVAKLVWSKSSLCAVLDFWAERPDTAATGSSLDHILSVFTAKRHLSCSAQQRRQQLQQLH